MTPRYKSHKQVQALKIKRVEVSPDNVTWITPTDERFDMFSVDDPTWRERYKGTSDDTGYYVIYEDGYTSWSPSKAFEEGYTRVLP
jgi:hypothetical protein